MHSREPVFQYSEFVYLSEFLKQGFQVLFLQVSGNLPDEKLDGVVVLHWNGVLADGKPVHPAGAVRGAESILLLHSVCSDCSHLSSMGRRAALSLSLSLPPSLPLSLSAQCTLSLFPPSVISSSLPTPPHSFSLPALSPLPFLKPPCLESASFICSCALYVFSISFLSFFFLKPPLLPLSPPTTTTTKTTTSHATLPVTSNRTLTNRPRPSHNLHNERTAQANGRAGCLRGPTGQSKNANICVEWKAWDVHGVWRQHWCDFCCLCELI